MQQKLCYETSQGVLGTCCLHLQGGRALKTGIRIYQHTVLLSGNRTVKLVTPSCCSLDNQQNYKHFGGLHKDWQKTTDYRAGKRMMAELL